MPSAPPQHRPAWWKPREVSERERKAKVDQKRKDDPSRKLYQTREWRALRKQVLQANPFCVVCQKEGRLIPATVVDHKRPHKGDVAKFYDAGNLQPMCKRHHDAKTAREDGGFGRGRGLSNL